MRKFLDIFLAGALSFGMNTAVAAMHPPAVDKASLSLRTTPMPDMLIKAFNAQVKNEFDGAQVYLAMSHHFYLKGLDGFGFYYTQQYYEELNHARILIDFLRRKNASLDLGAVEAPQAFTDQGPKLLVSDSLNLEQLQTQRLHSLYDKAVKAGSPDSAILLQWFVNEQVEEEDIFQTLVDRIELIADAPEGLLQIDKELGARAPAVIWQPGQPLP